MKWGFLFLSIFALFSCTLTSLNQEAFKQSEVRNIGIVIGSGPRAVKYIKGGLICIEVFTSLPASLENELNEKVLNTLLSTINSKGYNAVHLKTVHSEWDLYSDLSDSPQSYDNLLIKYRISSTEQKVDAILFVEYLLQPKGFRPNEKLLSQLAPNHFEVTYAKAKLWLYDLRTGARLFFAVNQKGYDKVLSHVTPDAALNDLLVLENIPDAKVIGKGLEK